jgi:hypothetical protein
MAEAHFATLSGGRGPLCSADRPRVMSALPPEADMVHPDRDVRFVPKADMRLEPKPNQTCAKKAPGVIPAILQRPLSK